MKPTKLTLVPNPFVNVARRIAEVVQPPEWLIGALKHFGTFIQAGNEMTPVDREFFRGQIKQMHDATETLLRLLPAFEHLGLEIRYPDEVKTALAVLPRIKELIAKADVQRTGGHPLNVRREICAAVVFEAWKLIHGKAPHRSVVLLETCNEYWRACGGEELGKFGDLDNWRRSAERAKDGDNEWIRSALLTVRNQV